MNHILALIKFLCLSKFVLLIFAENDCECGKHEHISNSRIYKGTTADPRRFPWQILIILTENSNAYYYGGVLISKKHIVTCAHCMEVLMNQEYVCIFEYIASKMF